MRCGLTAMALTACHKWLSSASTCCAPGAVGDKLSKGPVGETQDVAVRHLEEALELPLFDDGQIRHFALRGPLHFAFPAAAGIRTTFWPLFFSGTASGDDSFVAMRRAS